MDIRRLLVFIATCWLAAGSRAQPATESFRQLHESPDSSRAILRVLTSRRAPQPIPRWITGKFAEHLGANIYNGMDAQILRNPTFADYPFWNGQMTPDGVTQFQVDNERIAQAVRAQAERSGWPESELGALVAAHADGLACFWTRVGPRDAVQVSPDTAPSAGRAQRIQVRAAGQGIAQWTYLPLHRVRRFEFDLWARSPDVVSLTIRLTPPVEGSADEAREAAARGASATLNTISPQWRKFSGRLELPSGSPVDSPYRLTVTASSAGQFVLGHLFLRPADHVHGADPDVVRLLKESRLPILRWPGGNFASTYHWEDGVGRVELRPTKPNYAWGAIEPNTFGTDEFMAFCRAAGCEPMICVNAGSGTPEEAARWIEYCNGPATSPMGARRAANGHPTPYHVTHWEVGNELWGRWQFGWTTATGYVDRYREFSKKMRAADPTLELYACGAPVLWGKAWNNTLVTGAAASLQAITDHPLIGGPVSPTVDPLEVYRDFMAVPGVLEEKWAGLDQDMTRAGIRQPRLAVTELQLFAHLGHAPDGQKPARLTRENLVNPGTLAEALYDVLIYHAAVRLQPFVEMVTHSAVVNHGGGLRKERERVYANPCFYAQAAFAAFTGATPVAIDLTTPLDRAPMVLPDLRNAVPAAAVSVGSVDALAALATDGGLLLSIVHRGTTGPIRLSIDVQDFKAGEVAELRTLTADVPWAANTLEAPEAVTPHDAIIDVKGGRLELNVRPYTVLRARIPPRR